ncbi:MAG: hypothetical protein UT63_C0022G0004 [Candidatus Gottesmanbacteria bacterium GW2011_GWC2_39_8]|uniref:Cohesin domain-containing protein n=1 Tax=Candidatus Gottesmanbacteria bacterium GW2011_GWC2_39_8 TaxID=1618450 RepID=A0A0G0Q772_9BACT|nr:MAG: hypothetical protein UT63_C0022G0004 [Candidatus Gottesmanbacteria bacterium GW2011_GWC2_39_8]
MNKKIFIGLFFLVLFAFHPSFVRAAEISLITTDTDVKVGDNISVDITLSGNEDTLGTDVIMIYDPVIITPIEVTNGSIYPTYNPAGQARLSTKGKIFLSGSASIGKPVPAKGTFATVTFEAKSGGRTTISFDYEKGSTSKTGIIDFKGNDLISNAPEKVNLQIEGPVVETRPESAGNSVFPSQDKTDDGFWSRFLSLLTKVFPFSLLLKN